MTEDKLIPLITNSLSAIQSFRTYITEQLNTKPEDFAGMTFGVSYSKKHNKDYAEYKGPDGTFKITVSPQIPKITVRGKFKDTGEFQLERSKISDITIGNIPKCKYWDTFFSNLFG